VPEATGLERHRHCERSVAISGIAEPGPKRRRGIPLLAMTQAGKKDERNQSQRYNEHRSPFV
jgi:hypothetical protein